MGIDSEEDHHAFRQSEGQEDKKRLKKRGKEPLTEPPKEGGSQWKKQYTEIDLQIRKMDLHRQLMEIEMMTKIQKIQEMPETDQEMCQPLYQQVQELDRKVQELDRKVQVMAENMQENVNPRSKGELQLLFVNELHGAIFTRDKIRDRDGGYVKIQLINTASDGLTVKKGFLSDTEIEIVVLDGDFGFDGNENWTEEEFNAKIIHTKRGAEQPLVKGKFKIKLTDGVGTIEDLSFSVISNCTSSKKFRLGARATCKGLKIKEARSEAFAVRHHRTKNDHSKKLENGGKFHQALIDNGIPTKSHLKHMYKTNPKKLRDEILKGCLDKEWDAFVQYIIHLEDDANSNTAISGPTLQQGILQNNRNHSCQQPEYLQEPPAMPTSQTHVNAQFELINGIVQPPNYGGSYWNPCQSNAFCPSLSIHHMAQPSQINDTQDAYQHYNEYQPQNLPEPPAMPTFNTHANAQFERSNAPNNSVSEAQPSYNELSAAPNPQDAVTYPSIGSGDIENDHGYTEDTIEFLDLDLDHMNWLIIGK